MKPRHFLTHVAHQEVLDAIREAEQGTSGDIVVLISHRAANDALAAAHAAFRKLRLDRARAANSFLIFVAPRSQSFALVGGTALHEKVGQAWWDETVAELGLHFREGRFGPGLVNIIRKAGAALKAHFPDASPDRSGQVDIVEE